MVKTVFNENMALENKICLKHLLLQVPSETKYPWVAQLIVRDLDFHENPVQASECSATLVFILHK